MTIEFARNVLGLVGRQLHRVRHRQPPPVIDLMDAQRDVVDMGGTMRLGAYYAVLTPGTGCTTPTASRSSPSATATATSSTTPTAPGSRRPASLLSRPVARRPAGRVHRAGRPPVLGRHPSPPRVQEPPRSPPPAVPRADRAALAPRPRVATRHLYRRSTCRSGGRAAGVTARRVPPRRRARGPPGPHLARRVGDLRGPRRRPFERDVVRSPGAVGVVPLLFDAEAPRRGARAPVPARRSTPSCSRSRPGMRDVDGEEPPRPPAASWSRRSASAPGGSSC